MIMIMTSWTDFSVPTIRLNFVVATISRDHKPERHEISPLMLG